jgi:hypothetical protein
MPAALQKATSTDRAKFVLTPMRAIRCRAASLREAADAGKPPATPLVLALCDETVVWQHHGVPQELQAIGDAINHMRNVGARPEGTAINPAPTTTAPTAHRRMSATVARLGHALNAITVRPTADASGPGPTGRSG